MSTVLIHDSNIGTAIKEHIEDFSLRPLILISQIIGMPPDEIDVFTIGICPSKELINVVAAVLQKLIKEREDYLTGRETT